MTKNRKPTRLATLSLILDETRLLFQILSDAGADPNAYQPNLSELATGGLTLCQEALDLVDAPQAGVSSQSIQ